MPPVRLAPREELAAAARVAPLLRAARELSRWAQGFDGLAGSRRLSRQQRAAAAAELEMAPTEVDMAWEVAAATGAPDAAGRKPDAEAGAPDADGWAPGRLEALALGDAEEVLALWDRALQVTLAAEDLDGLATALYTVGAPVRMESLFEAYAAAAGTQRQQQADRQVRHGEQAQEYDQGAALSRALETLADLGVVELGTEEAAGGLTVALSPLGIWGVHRRLRAQGWHVPVLGSTGRAGAAPARDPGQLRRRGWRSRDRRVAGVADCRPVGRGTGHRGQDRVARAPGAAFAVLDRVGAGAAAEVRAALDDPLLRAHAAVWLHEHGEEAELTPEDRTWLLVDLGAGLLEEADPHDVVAELLPEVPARTQAEIVGSLWQVSHPGVTGLLTALGEHHPDPAVARAARKAAFKARSPSAGKGRVTP